MAGFKIRPVRPDEIKALSDLVNSAYRGESSRAGWTTEADLLGGQRTDPELLAEMIQKPSQVILVAIQNQSMVGSVFLKREASGAYLGMLTIRPTAQGAGLGQLLLCKAESWIQKNWHSDSIRMTVIRQRAELIAWYERRGYQQTGEREPFPYGNDRFGIPHRPDLEFFVLQKSLATGSKAPA